MPIFLEFPIKKLNMNRWKLVKSGLQKSPFLNSIFKNFRQFQKVEENEKQTAEKIIGNHSSFRNVKII